MFHCSTEMYLWSTLSIHQPPSVSVTSPRKECSTHRNSVKNKCQISVTFKETQNYILWSDLKNTLFFIDSIFIMRKFHWKWRKSLFSMSVAYRSENFIWLNSKLPFHIIYSALELESFFLFSFCIYFIEHLPTHQIVHQKTFSLAN